MSSQWNQIATLLGPAGFSTQSGSGRPQSTLGNIGDIYIDTTNAVLYASKTSAGWPSSGRSLVGPVTQTILPSDITGNSLSLASVSGDSHGVGISIANATGNVFSVDGSGNLSAQASTVASLASGGVVSGSTFVSGVGALNNPAFAFNSQIDTGLYLPSASPSAAVMALVVNAATALTLTKNGVNIPGTLSVSGSMTVGTLNASNVNNTGSGSAAGYLSSIAGSASAPSFSYTSQADSGVYLAAASASAAVLAFAVNGVQALALSKSGVTVPGTLSAQGSTTLAGLSAAATSLASLGVSGAGTFAGLVTAPSVKLNGVGGQITFPDGTTQSSAAVTSNPGVASTFTAGNAGSTTAPSFLFAAQLDSGLYLANTSSSAAILAFSVNKTQSFAMSAAGVSVPGTLTVSGATTLQALTVSSLSNSGTTTSLGHTVSANGVASAPSYSFVAQPDTGMYLPTQSSTAAVLGFSVNATLALNILKTGINIPGTLTVSGTSTFGAISGTTLTLSGNETIGGTSSITGLLTASGNITTPILNTTQAPSSRSINGGNYLVSNVTVPGTFGDGYGYPASGISSDSLGNVLINYQGIPFIRSSNPGYNSATGTSPSTAFITAFQSGSYTFSAGGNTLLALSGSTAKYGFNANTVPFTMQALSGNILVLQNGGTAPSYTTTTVGTVSTAGLATFTGLALSSATGVTFADNSVQTTAFNAASAGTLSKFTATASGSAAAPVFTFSSNTDTGAYLKTSSSTAAILSLAVNAVDAITLSKSGASIPGTLAVTGALTANAGLTITGSTSAGALSTTGLITAPNITLGTSGKLTFGDGTSLTTAALGSSPTYTASGGSLSTPAFSFTSNTDTGLYLRTSSTTAAIAAMSVNGTDATWWSKTGVTVQGTLTTNGAATLSAGLTTTSATINGIIYAGAGGSVSAPVINLSNSNPGSGIWYSSSTPVGVNFTLQGTNQLSLQSGLAIFNGAVQGQYFRAANGTATYPAVSNQSGGSTGLYFPTNNSWALVAGASGSGVVQVQGTGTALTLSTPVTVQSTMATQGTVTSSTVAGTPSFVSSQGFRSNITCTFWNSSYTAATASQMQLAVVNNGNNSVLGSTPFVFVFPVAGSIVSLISSQAGPITGTNTFAIYKNGTSVYSWNAGTTATNYTNFNKATYAFAAGDVLTLYHSNSASGNTQVTLHVTIELPA